MQLTQHEVYYQDGKKMTRTEFSVYILFFILDQLYRVEVYCTRIPLYKNNLKLLYYCTYVLYILYYLKTQHT